MDTSVTGILGSLTQASPDSDRTDSLLDGIHENIKDIDEMIPNKQAWFSSMLSLAQSSRDNISNISGVMKEFRKNMSRMMSDGIGGSKLTGSSVAGGRQDKDPASRKGAMPMAKLSGLKPSDLAGMPAAQVAGALLLYGPLSAIAKAIAEGTAAGKKGGNDDGGAGGIGGKISGLFSGIGKGIGSIAALGLGLMAFAGALVLFNSVNWLKALLGMAMFAAFIGGAVVVAQNLKANAKDIAYFSFGAMMLSAGLLAFALAVKVTSILSLRDYMTGLLAVALYYVFLQGVVRVANSLEKTKGKLLDFAKASIILAAGIAVFAVAVLIAGFVGNMIISQGLLPKVGLMLGLYVGFTALAIYGSRQAKNFFNFAKASLLLAASIAAFALVVILCGFIKPAALGYTAAVLVFMGASLLAAVAIAKVLVNPAGLYKVALAGLLLAVGVGAFALVVILCGKIKPTDFLKTLGVIAFISALAVAVIFAQPYLLAACGGAVLMAAFGVLFYIGVAGVSRAFKAAESIGKDAVTNMADLMLALSKAMLATVLLIPALVLGLVSAKMLQSWGNGVMLAFNAVGRALEIAEKLPDDESIDSLKLKISKIKDLISAVISSFKFSALDIIAILGFNAMIKPVVAAMRSLGTIFGTVSGIANSPEAQTDVTPMMASLQAIISGIADEADRLDGVSSKGVKKFQKIVGAVSGSCESIASMMSSFSDFAGEEGRKRLDTARAGISYVVENILSATGEGSIVSLFSSLSYMSAAGDPAAAAKALSPVVSAVADTGRALADFSEINIASSAPQVYAVVSFINTFQDKMWHLNLSADKLSRQKAYFAALPELFSNIRLCAPSSDIVRVFDNMKFLSTLSDSYDFAAAGKSLYYFYDSYAAGLSLIKEQSIQGIADSMTALAASNPRSVLDPFILLASNAGKIQSVADSMRRIADSVKTIDKHASSVGAIGSLNGGMSMKPESLEQKQPAVNSLSQGVSPEDTIIKILTDIKTAGIPIRQPAASSVSEAAEPEQKNLSKGWFKFW